jgi:hypothetical protein
MRIAGFKGFAQVDTNTAWAVPMKRFADQLREARAADPLPPLLRAMDEIRQRATGEAQQPPSSFAHLFDPDLERLTFDVVTDDSVKGVKPVQPAKRTRKRKPTLAGVARQASKVGVDVARYDFRPDGTISIVTGKPVDDNDTNDTDPKWN